MFCEVCGTKNEEGVAFCTECGAQLNNEATMQTAEVTGDVVPMDTAAIEAQGASVMNKLPKLDKKVITGIAIGAACLVAVVVLGTVASKTIFKGKNSFTDHPIIYAQDSKLLYRRTYKKDAIELTDDLLTGVPMESYEMYSYVQTTDDGKMIFFIDDSSLEGGKLCYRKTSQKKVKGKNAAENGYEIASKVTSFSARSDGKGVFYEKNGAKLCYYNMKEEKSIASDVSSYYVTEDYKYVIYDKIDDSDLYISGIGKNDEPEKIDSEITDIERVTEKGVYYSKEGDLYYAPFGKEKEKVASDFSSIMKVDESYYLFTEEESDDSSSSYSRTFAVHTLDGAKTEKLDEGFVNAGRMLRKVDSDNDSEYTFLKKNGDLVPLGEFEYDAYNVTDDEKYLYAIQDMDDEGYGTLNRYKITKDGLDSKEEIAEDVASMNIYDDGNILIRGDETTGLYDGKYKEISEDYISVERYDDGVLYYINDDDDFVMFKNGKNKTIDSDVHDVDIRDNNFFYYIKDYSDSKYKGDLYMSKGGKAKKVDEDVRAIYKPADYFWEED